MSPTPTVRHAVDLRVRYCECDPMGVAHHGSYAAWLEIARTELLRSLGRSYRSVESEGLFLVITQLSIRYRRPIRYDDVLRVEVRVAGGTRTRIDHEYEIRLIEREGSDAGRLRDAGEDLLSTASTTLACVDRTGRPTPLPGWLVSGDGAIFDPRE